MAAPCIRNTGPCAVARAATPELTATSDSEVGVVLEMPLCMQEMSGGRAPR